MKQQFLVTHRYTILQDTRKTWRILSRRVVFWRKYKDKQFFGGQYILRVGVFVSHLSGDEGFRCNELCELR